MKLSMKQRVFIALGAVLIAVGSWWMYQKNILPSLFNSEVVVNPAFEKYIEAYTSGQISSEGEIKIILAVDAKDSVDPNEPIAEELFDFSPNIPGKAYWVSANTIVFKPDVPLNNGTKYSADFYLSKIIEVTESDLKTFEFGFKIMPQNFEVETEGIAYYDKRNLKRLKVKGTLYTADVANHQQIEKMLLAGQNNKSLKITWDHQLDRKTHRFIVEDVERDFKSSDVSIQWNGEAIGVESSDEVFVEIPNLNEFKLMSIRVINTPDQIVKIQMSDPLSELQDINGLVVLKNLQPSYYYDDEESENQNQSAYSVTVVDNEIHLFPTKRMAGSANVYIDKNIKNILEVPLNKTISEDIDFGKLNPAVEMKGEGVILPTDEGLMVTFKAVNLKSVNLKVYKIFENNMHQFLQENELDGDYELRRVAAPVLIKKMNLQNAGAATLNKWNSYQINLSDYIKVEPGVIYRVVISFKKEDAFTNCGGVTEKANELSTTKNPVDQEDEYSLYDNDNYYYDEDFDWKERNNPCNSAFYEYSKYVARNILASDIGIIAKGGTNGNYVFIVNDIKTTKPLSGVKLELFSFQKQLITTLETNNEGIAEVKLTKKAFLLVATYNNQKGYLKLDDGKSLSVSNFNVSGEQIQKGIKGYLYGERGIWRPGDSLYLTFVLNDLQNKLPSNHPVVFELMNPKNQLVKRIVKSNNVNHFYTFHTKTNSDAPTGNWIANIKVGTATFSKVIRIETIKPNRIKINLDFGKEKLNHKDNPMKAVLKANWLHGMPAANLKAKVDLTLTRGTTSFDQYPNYVFEDNTKYFESSTQTLFEEKLNAEGQANVQAKVEFKNQSPGVLNATFKTTVREEGGDESVDRQSIAYYPYSSLVGMQLNTPNNGVFETDKEHVIQIVAVNEWGQLVKRDKVTVEMYKLTWRWWWDQDEDESHYISNQMQYTVTKEELRLVNGKAQWKFNRPNSEWGRYLIRITDPVSKHASSQIVFVDSYYGGSRSQNTGSDWANLLSFNANKYKYAVGEKIELNIPSSKDGRALISIENGSKVLKTFWTNTQAGTTQYSFEASADMSPNIFVHVTLLQPYKNTNNDLPIRMYGVIPLLVENANSHLDPKIEMPKVLKPAQTFSLKVSETKGKEMTYTLAIVDEGLLDLTRFKTPNPWNTFYAKEGLGVKTWDLYDYVCRSQAGQLEKILSIGGDGEIRSGDGTKANRFKPVVKYIGPFVLKKGETNTHAITLPNYVGSVRTMVVAGNNEGAYGSAEVATPVRQSIMVLGTLPRVLSPDEEVVLPVSVFANEPQVKNATVKVQANDLFTIVGATSQSVSFAKPSEKMLYFKLKTKRTLGVGKVKIVATSGSVSIPYEIEIDVRNPNQRVSDVKEFVLNPGQTINTSVLPIGAPHTNSYQLEISSMQPINLNHRLNYLINYPHGCIEQTTSAVFPQLYLNDLIDLTPKQKTEIEFNIKAAIDKIQSFQTASGGFSYWPKQQEADEWGSNYAGHFLVEAQRKGYAVPLHVLKQWKAYQNVLANAYVDADNAVYKTNTQGYRLYTLALAGSINLSAMNRMREQKNLSALARWELAAAYMTAGQVEIGKSLLAHQPLTIAKYDELAYTYGSTERDRAILLEVLTLSNDKVNAFAVMKSLSAALSSGNWMSTQTTAYALIAIAKFAKKHGSNQVINVNYVLNGKRADLQNNNKQMLSQSLALHESKSNTLNITNQGKGMVYVRVVGNGIPWVEKSLPGANDLKMNVVYKNLKGELIDAKSLAQGTSFMAEVSIRNESLRGNLKQLALTQVFAAGWEITNTRLDVQAESMQLSIPDYIDYKDDRVLSYFNLNAGETKTFRVLLNASYKGKYYLPMFSCEAMYDASIYARNASSWVEVK
jgi:uncharacterized protein YfaS (alpha-2-macroglobulin family)